MAFEQVIEGLEIALPAGADLRTNLHCIVTVNSSGQVILATSATGHLFGVIREVGNTGEPVTVQFGGIAKCIAGTALTTGVRVTTDGAGKVVAAVAGNCVLGVVVDPPSIQTSDVVSVALLSGSV